MSRNLKQKMNLFDNNSLSRNKDYNPTNIKNILINNKNDRIKDDKRNKTQKIYNKYKINNIRKFIEKKVELLIMIIFLTIQVFSNDNVTLSKFSNITLKINGNGQRNILGHNFSPNYYPIIIIINGILQENIDFQYYFNQTENLVQLIWNTSNLNCSYMFLLCSDISEIDLSHFNTSKVTVMYNMFESCTSLISLNLSNLDTSQVVSMNSMFYNCSSLTLLDLSNFDTSKVEAMYNMFNGCSSLISLNLSSFNTPNVKTFGLMFFNCISLKYINLKGFVETYLEGNEQMFDGLPDNLIICVNESNKMILSELYKKSCYTIDCSEKWQFEMKNIINTTGICYDINDNDIQYKYEYKGIYYENCINGTLITNLSINKCKCSINYIDFYPKEDDLIIDEENINCYKEPKGYYLDKNNSLYKKCYHTCETCEIKGDKITHNCLSCNSNYSYEIIKNNNINCYENCNFYHYFDSDNNYFCTMNSSCPVEYPILLEDKKECRKRSIEELIQNLLQNETQKGKEEEIIFYDSILKLIESYFTSEGYDLSNLMNGKDEFITTKKLNITLTTTQNQKNNLNNINMTIIDLEHCETLLKNYYNISNDSFLYIKKIDITQDYMKIPKIEYDVYYNLNGTNLIKLNLSICENTKLSLSIPVEISENLNKLNISSDYFNDICYKAQSESGTDILLKDRQTDFIENNKTICQEDCDFYDYNYDIQIANCSCLIKESSNSYANMTINKSKLYENFGNSENNNTISNFGITSCNVLSSTENIESNTGFYLLLFILVIFFIIFIIFYCKGYNLFKDKIDETIYKRFKSETKHKKNEIIKDSKILPQRSKKKSKSKRQNKKILTLKQNNNSSHAFLDKKKNKNKNKDSKNITPVDDKDKKITEILDISNIKPDTDYEFNWLPYKLALKFDKRSGCEYYASLIRTKQLFMFTFCSFNDYNSGILKKFIFFLSFALHYTVNALFFNNSNMHQIYEDEGKFNFGYQFPYIIISAVVSTLVLRLILQFLVLIDKDILQVKLQPTKELAIKIKRKKLKCIKIRFIVFFVLIFILLTLFWYYLTCFNAIYENTQIYLIENTFISFGFSLMYPFIINILPTFIRMSAIHSSKKDKECLYKASKIIQII